MIILCDENVPQLICVLKCLNSRRRLVDPCPFPRKAYPLMPTLQPFLSLPEGYIPTEAEILDGEINPYTGLASVCTFSLLSTQTFSLLSTRTFICQCGIDVR